MKKLYFVELIAFFVLALAVISTAEFTFDFSSKVNFKDQVCINENCIKNWSDIMGNNANLFNKLLSINLNNFPGDASGRDFIRMISSSKTESDGKSGIYVLSAQNDIMTFRSADLNWGPGDIQARNIVSGRVGIGTVANPESKMEILLQNGGNLYFGLNYLNKKWAIYQEDVINPNYFGGNVGIGTSSPAYKLVIEGSDSNVRIGLNNKGGGKDWYLQSHTDGNFYIGQSTDLVKMTSNSVNVLSNTNFAVDGDGLVYDTSTNRVGIGITNPTAKLDVAGDIKVGGKVIIASACSESDWGKIVKCTEEPRSSLYQMYTLCTCIGIEDSGWKWYTLVNPA